MKKGVITVWKDGTWNLWSGLDAQYSADDPDWLVNISFTELEQSYKEGREELNARGASID